jgi:hypothetical protein
MEASSSMMQSGFLDAGWLVCAFDLYDLTSGFIFCLHGKNLGLCSLHRGLYYSYIYILQVDASRPSDISALTPPNIQVAPSQEQGPKRYMIR